MITILDCYTDEPAGLGVPPYVGTYPRYIAGIIYKEKKIKAKYTTIDDFRLWYKDQKTSKKEKQKTDIKVYNLTKNHENIDSIIQKSKEIIINLGVHTPGKYLSALPGTISELKPILKKIKNLNKNLKIILTGPGASEFGSGLFGGGRARKSNDIEEVDDVIPDFVLFENIDNYACHGAYILEQIPYEYIIELETGIGCSRGNKGCSFCTEPLKNNLAYRTPENIIKEVKALFESGAKRFRLGKQSCFYSYQNSDSKKIEYLLKGISKFDPEVLHIDNANPMFINEEITKLIVEYTTSGNIAAMGVESFDPEIIRLNNLNSTPEMVYKSVKIINKYGKQRGDNGLQDFLPGLNLMFGLAGETKKTHEHNMYWLKKMLEEDILLRRINIRQVVAFPKTPLYEMDKKLRRVKTKKYYWKWRNEIRQTIDFEMLKKTIPKDTILKDIYLEVHDGNHTFGRQFGTYPIIVGINQRLPLKKFVNVKITKHMLRSITGEII